VKQKKSPFKEEFMEGFSFIKSARLLSLLIVATVLNFLLAPLSTLLPYYVRFDHFGEASDLAVVMASLQAGILAGGLLMSIIKGFRKKMVVVAISIYVIFLGYALVALTPTGLFWFMAMSIVIMTFCIPIANVLTQTIFQMVVPMKMQGRVNSVVISLASAAQPIGMILSGTVVAFTGSANLFLGCAVLGILTMTVSWLFTDIRHVEKVEETSIETQPPTNSS